MKSQKKIRRLIGVIGVGILLFAEVRLPDVWAQIGLDAVEASMRDNELLREIERQEASAPPLQVWNLSPRAVKEAKLWAIAELGKAVFAALQSEEVLLPYKRLDKSFERLSQNISQEASLHSDYIRYGERYRLHDFWQHLGQLKQEQGKVIQRIVSLEERIKALTPENDYKASVSKTQSATLISGPGALSIMFSHWKGFYFLISGGFFFINVLLFFTCMELETRTWKYGKTLCRTEKRPEEACVPPLQV